MTLTDWQGRSGCWLLTWLLGRLLASKCHAHRWSRPAKPGQYLLRNNRNRAVVGQHDALYPGALTGRYLPGRFLQLLPPFGSHAGELTHGKVATLRREVRDQGRGMHWHP
jgi:hypothetical protein